MPDLNSTYADILEQVRSWPARERLNLAQALLASLHADLQAPVAAQAPASTGSKRPLTDLVGLIKCEGPPPSDEECRRLLEEELLKKYGG